MLRLLPPSKGTHPQVALVTAEILHQEELAEAAHFAGKNDSRLLIQSLDSANDDIFGRIRCIKAALSDCAAKDIQLSILPTTASNDASKALFHVRRDAARDTLACVAR